MDNNVYLDLDFSKELYKKYQDQFSYKDVPKAFEFRNLISISENLDNLALFALDPKTTLPVFYSYNPIFLEIVSRWIGNTSKFEQSTSTKLNGSTILSALSRLIGVSNEITNFIEYFVSKHDFSQRLKDLNIPELERVLLAFYRLINLDSHRFKQFIIPNVLYSILNINDESYNVAKYLSVKILSVYLNASEVSHNEMMKNHISGSLISSFESTKKFDYQFLPIIEAERLSNFTKLPKPTFPITSNSKVVAIKPTDLHPLVTSVCGVLVPHFINKPPLAISSEDKDFLVYTENSVRVLRALANHIQNSKPVMLYGRAGSGKTFLINQLAKFMKYENNIVKIHLGEQTDGKLLLGTYCSGEKPGTFQWRSGVLTTAVKEGKWVLIEDIDKAPTEVLSVLLTLLEKRELSIPSRGEVIKAKNGFQLISTIRITNDNSKTSLPDLIGLRKWELINVQTPTEVDFKNILTSKFPLLTNLAHKFIKCFNEVVSLYNSSSFISLNKGAHPRVISFRDLIKFCSRCDRMLSNKGITSGDQLLESSIYDNIFAEAVDCFGSAITEYSALLPIISTIGEILEIPTSRINLFLNKHVPNFQNDDEALVVGRAKLIKVASDKALFANKKGSSFARTNHSLRLMEQIGVSIDMAEPVLLVGETGTGKTTVVQQMAKLMNKNITVINVSQQTESGDLLGGFKPVNTKTVAIPIQETFENLFLATFSKKKNEKFSVILSKCLNKNQWKNVIKLWKEAVRMAKDILNKPETDSDEEGAPKKKRKVKSGEKQVLLNKWKEFEVEVKNFEIHASSLDNSFVFNFIEGSLVKAVRNGEWLLLDEINLASADTLESIADLFSETLDQRSVLLSERGDIEPVRAHPNFRIFCCMNPSTDVGKRDLPLSIRSRFTEIYVHSPDRDIQDLLAIIDKYIGRYAIGDEWVGNDIAELYLEAKKLSELNKIVDGANQKPHFSIRTLTRTLIYVCDIVSIYGLRRSLYEGFCMSFLTLLDAKSEEVLKPLIIKHTIGRLKNAKSVMSQCPTIPNNEADAFVQFQHYWLKRGPSEIIAQDHYIITPFVEKNLLNLVRATAGRRFPVLVQGPTSAGKTSMIQYLANITGHKFVRINNHEHTDLQEYLGTYLSDDTGKLTFKEGVLVEALRKGHWIVLDELNLAPTDVLEALNRLLDDNRELFIPETQEVVHPHPDFMLFATQNPPGLYGGRKVLSRAFRNRFLELHFDDIPQDELEIILKERCQIAPTYAKKIVEVYKQLSVQRQSSRLFEQKNSFATLRDLFRWALRDAVGYEELAANGYMLLAERVRKEEEKLVVKEIIEKVMKVRLDIDAIYEHLENEALLAIPTSIVWTKAMRRLAVLVMLSIKYNEPLLLVGETGCGKTTICQVVAEFMKKQLIVVNAHQNTETGDLLGAQRPVRNRFETRSHLFNNLVAAFEQLEVDIPSQDAELTTLIKKFESLDTTSLSSELVAKIEEGKRLNSVLFEWSDGPLVNAMKTGNFFLLDEISLADDSVLERLNSVLEPERSLLLAEKGAEDSFVKAADSFQFLATMNPGGDYGKKELSPALRNRFTEIWVSSMEDFDDVTQIVSSRLTESAKSLSPTIVSFSEWFGKEYGGGNARSGVISLRDILAWVEFINSCMSSEMSPEEALVHGAAMVFIDALGTNNTAYLAEDEERLSSQKKYCFDTLSKICNQNLWHFICRQSAIQVLESSLTAGPFSIDRVSDTGAVEDFNLSAPTTSSNAMKVVRAMQVHKPILLEGSPGVGKTSLVSAIAKATGNTLIRINLSEQTDLVDLFGSDAPAEGGKTGEFVWRDAPFLRAMQQGEWVLLDEMNLASQSVLEGLNACLDHRGVAYIPELDKSFSCHPKFTVFAAQNPQYQGGGRKGLPKSFINRFTVVYVDVLKSDDFMAISEHLFPKVDRNVSEKMIAFMSKLEEEVVIKKLWGSSGGPWEFNLRDTLRWLSLYSSTHLSESITPYDFFNMIIKQRFRTEEDRASAEALFLTFFEVDTPNDNFYSLGTDYLQVGGAIMKRKDLVQYANNSNLLPLQCNFSVIESAIRCINQNTPLILTGPTNSGKTDLVRFLAHIVGAELDEFALNSEIDSMDILGGYEQVDLTRSIMEVVSDVRRHLNGLVVQNISSKKTEPVILSQSLEFLKYIDTSQLNTSNYDSFHQYFKAYSTLHTSPVLNELLVQSEALNSKTKEDKSVKFAWFDGLLVKAVTKGNWLVLDNANLCNPSVLDRLNSLLETNGTLIINECSSEDGQPRVLQPHPNFRLFLTVDPKYGELSRAMRNRGVEIFMTSLADRSTKFDLEVLGLHAGKQGEDIEEKMKLLSVVEKQEKPLGAFIPSNISSFRFYYLLLDFLNDSEGDTQIINAALASLPSNVAKSMKQFYETFALSDDVSPQVKDSLHHLSERIDYLLSIKFDTKIDELYQIVEERTQGCDFISNQSLHPLWNSYLKTSLQKSSPYVDSSDLTLAFEVASAVFDSSSLLSKLENLAISSKVGDLTYVERSAAAALGRDIKKVPRLEIYLFIKRISQLIGETFARTLQENLFNHEATYHGLYQLQIIWKNLLEVSKEQNEANLRVYQTLVVGWIEKYKSHEFFSDFIVKLTNIVDLFGSKLALTSGYSMSEIWEHFRPLYPSSAQNWSMYTNLVDLAAKFDQVANEQYLDASDLVITLRKLFITLYEDVLNNRTSNEYFAEMTHKLQEGIEKLHQISESFTHKRYKLFTNEFELLSNFIESSSFTKYDDTDAQLALSTLSDKPTVSFFQPRGSWFSPYPRMFDSLLYTKNGRFESNVPGLFSNDLVVSIVSKGQRMQYEGGRNIAQSFNDLKALGQSFVKNSQPLLTEQRIVFQQMLLSWLHHILQAHNVPVDTLTGGDISELQRIVEDNATEDNTEFVAIVKRFLLPSLNLAYQPSISSLGKAWVLFSCGVIQLFVPSSAYDPAIKEHIVYRDFLEQQKMAQRLINAWEKLRKVAYGDDKIHIETTLPQLEESGEPKRPRVFRNQDPLDGLFDEWSAFMESTIDINPIKSLLESAEDLTSRNRNIITIFQNNSSQFLARLKLNFHLYSDLNDILSGYVLALKFGVELLVLGDKESNPQNDVSPAWPVNFDELANSEKMLSVFDKVKEFSKSLSLDSVLPESLMTHFIRTCFFQNIADEHSKSILAGAFQSLYYRWSLRRMKKEEEANQEGKLYKYADADIDVEEDFKALFPDYEDVMEVHTDSKKANESFDTVYFELAKLYTAHYLQADEDASLTTLVQSGASLTESLSTFNDVFNLAVHSPAQLSSTVVLISETLDSISSKKDQFDFYRDGSPAEFKRAMTIATSIYLRTMKLLEEWPEHATLQNIARACDELLSFPMNSPISKVLQKIEQIYTYIAEWEKYAAGHVSLKTYFDELTKLIVSWRQLELSTWKALFDHEDKVLEQNLGKWWFYLFETIIVPSFSNDEPEEQSVIKLVEALNIFMSETTYGEFVTRLNLVKAFKAHVFELSQKGPIFNALSNFIIFYSQFTSTVVEAIDAGKKKLEKDINEVILLASWKDVNIDALKQSARRSHNSLYKIVRKYRALLAISVSSIIEQGVNFEKSSVIKLPEIPALSSVPVKEQQIADLRVEVATWKERPQRLQDLSTIDKNMTVYVSRLASEEFPSLEPYTVELMEEMERLRKETPKEANEKNKKLIASLKTQKRKLLSDTLKELRRIGLGVHLRADIHKVQKTINSVLSTSTTFEGSLLQGSDPYFYKILDLLPKLRAAVSNVAEGVPQVDVEKGLAVAENLIFSLITTRKPLYELADSIKQMDTYFSSLDNISKFDSSTILARTSVVSSSKLSLSVIEKSLYWLQKILLFSVTASQAIGALGCNSNPEFIYSIKQKAIDLETQLKDLDKRVVSSSTSDFIHSYISFYDETVIKLRDWASKNGETSFLAYSILEWLQNGKNSVLVNTSTSLLEIKTLEDIEREFRKLSNLIMISVQKVLEFKQNDITEEDDEWLVLSKQRLFQYIKSSNHKRVVHRLSTIFEIISKVEHNSDTSRLTTAIISFTLPLIRHYFKLIIGVFQKTRENYVSTSKSTFLLSHALYKLASKGFCDPQPPTEEKQDDNLHDGTGLGDGEGATNNSKDIEQDDDLTEDAQKPNEEQDKDEDGDEENDDAVEMEGDMAGDLEDASDQEDGEDGKSDEELDEEVDDIDDLDPNAIDEKMWDEEVKDDKKEKDSDKMPENSNNDDEMEANEGENEEENSKEKTQSDDKNEEDENEEKDDENASDGEDQDVGEQEDAVRNDDNEQLEENVDEADALELPEDMNLDGDDEEDKDDGEEEDEKFDDGMDVDEEDGKKEENAEPEQNEEGEEREEEESEAETEEDNGEQENEEEEEGEPATEEPGVNEDEGMESEEEEVENKGEDGGEGDDNNDLEQDKAEGVDGADENAGDDDMDKESAVKKEFGEKGEGADNQVMDENDDLGAVGGASMDQQQDQKDEEKSGQDDAREMAKESLKQLGDSLKEFHRRHQEIQQASEDKEEKAQQSANERPDEFQHVDGQNTDFDTQALGAADKDQIQSIDEDKAIDDDEQKETEVNQEVDVKDEDAMDVDGEEVEVKEEDEAEIDPDFEGKTKGGIIGERKTKNEEGEELIIKTEFEDERFSGVVDTEEKLTDDIDELPPRGVQESRELWKESELATQELASGLCEQLRLILEPTLATKLRGDYKTGKRLNMKRIIPYIASEFRKDKIWLRRTKPSKRQYQIMIAVDDSKSMSESKSTELAFHSIALVCKALTQLESGDLSIVRFGEDVKVVHPFDKPFNNQETGSKIFQWFDFQQTRTDIKLLCNKALKIFETAKSQSNNDLWQLQIIISDGVCEDHATVQRLVRKAREEKIMLVFVIIDGINSRESILDMSQVSYVSDPNTGAMNLKVDKYLDSFPFEFYVVVRNINELPEMLSLILRQYFSEIAAVE